MKLETLILSRTTESARYNPPNAASVHFLPSSAKTLSDSSCMPSRQCEERAAETRLISQLVSIKTVVWIAARLDS